jgi:hypothetical protein
MTDPKEKPRREIKVREPKKAKPDTFANLRPLPTVHPIEEILNLPATTHHSPPLTTTQGQSPPVTNPAPARDFNRRANSLERDALPAGIFTGSSKKIYDALYLRTRGAVVPRKLVRASRKDLLAWTGIKNLKTIDAQLRLLMTVGLIIRHWERGQIDGSEYEVRLPEEVYRASVPTTLHHSPPDTTTQNMTGGYTQNLGSGGDTQTADFKSTSNETKTDLRLTDRSDDEPLAELIAKFEQVSRETTGRGLSVTEQAKWGELAELLMAEFKIAAARTGQVSNVPAFLTEHLRRRLWKKDKAQLERESREVGSEPAPLVDTSKCPDCGGSSWWYPEGTEKGVAKCRHTKLLSP